LYNVLLKAKYDEQSAESFLLLSHASNDGHRPSRHIWAVCRELA
jgi:hypothetical protein